MADWPPPSPHLIRENPFSLVSAYKNGFLPVGYFRLRHLCLEGFDSPVTGDNVKLEWCWVAPGTRGTSVEAYTRYLERLNGFNRDPAQSQPESQNQESS